jgi:hypothetical protein
MNTRGIVLIVTFWLVLARGVSAQVPPNDNYANRIALIGNNVVFAGSLSGSTVEANEPTDSSCYYSSSSITRSVWWTWTAAETVPVTLVALSYSEDTFVQDIYWHACLVAVYEGTNVFGSPAATPKACLSLDAAFNKLAVSFQATAGTAYQIQLLGVHPTLAVTLQLVATNPPVILEAPTDQATFPGGSALFRVIATGLTPPSYAWRLNGTNLPGATNVMLALNYLALTQAGAYSVVVSNATGATTAGPANLILNANPLPPRLVAEVPNTRTNFAFTLIGEPGRYYRIESSTNLVNWRRESSFPSSLPILVFPPDATRYRSVIYSTNSSTFLSIPKGTNAIFVRASGYFPPDEVCNNNLKQIKSAIELRARSGAAWSRESSVIWTDLQSIYPPIAGLKCPAGGETVWDSYGTHRVCDDPFCMKAPAHVLEEPR